MEPNQDQAKHRPKSLFKQKCNFSVAQMKSPHCDTTHKND